MATRRASSDPGITFTGMTVNGAKVYAKGGVKNGYLNNPRATLYAPGSSGAMHRTMSAAAPTPALPLAKMCSRLCHEPVMPWESNPKELASMLQVGFHSDLAHMSGWLGNLKTKKEMAKRYQKLALYWHPDKWQCDCACAGVANQVLKMLNRAKEVAEKQLIEDSTPEKCVRPRTRECSRPADKPYAGAKQAGSNEAAKDACSNGGANNGNQNNIVNWHSAGGRSLPSGFYPSPRASGMRTSGPFIGKSSNSPEKQWPREHASDEGVVHTSMSQGSTSGLRSWTHCQQMRSPRHQQTHSDYLSQQH